jgi:hypothetical protein
VNLVNNLADAAVANAMANGVMQHPEMPQDSHSISSDVQAFFRAQGAPITLELPLPNNASASRIVLVIGGRDIAFDDDSACWGVTRKIRMTTLTQVRVLNTFKYNVRAQRDCDSLCK